MKNKIKKKKEEKKKIASRTFTFTVRTYIFIFIQTDIYKTNGTKSEEVCNVQCTVFSTANGQTVTNRSLMKQKLMSKK